MENAAELQTPLAGADLTPNEAQLLARAQTVADTTLEPHAEAVDQGLEPLRPNLDALADAGLAGVTTPTEWGGQGVSGAFQREFTELLTAACGTTWFTITQHLGSCGTFASSVNPSLRERYLRDMAAGRHYVGVGFGHLRRPTPMMTAKQVPGGYVLNGVAPWVTGWPYLSGVIFGAVIPDAEMEANGDQKHIYLYAPADENEHLHASPPLPLCAMNASATTEVTLTDLFVPDENFVRFSSRRQMAEGDERGIAGAVSPPLGCARGALKTLQQAGERRTESSSFADAADGLEREIAECRENARRWADGPKDNSEYKAGALDARAWAITLAVRATHMAVAASSGGANARTHPAQRRFREAMFYTLVAQTSDIMAATLTRLSK